ncbi:MAG: DUF2935 domain-containing protein [Bacillota bacterium]|nr:DUF2935 domain-containing protein [Bacillota bacterium]
MLSDREFVQQSLELNLFFLRIAKEHSIFLEAGFTQRDYLLMQQAENLKNIFSELLVETIRLSNGIVDPAVLNSGEITTDLTLAAERETEYYTSIPIDSNITRMEMSLQGSTPGPEFSTLTRQVSYLNDRAIRAANEIASFKAYILQNVLMCRLFTTNYPLLIDHILREAHFYLRMLYRLQRREETNIIEEAVSQEAFWNRIMAEHAKFIRGLLDPTEVKLFDTANNFGTRFDELTAETNAIMSDLKLLRKVTDDSLKAAEDIRDFKKQGTEGLINCSIRSIIFPLLGDHVIREANHYIRLLKQFQRTKQTNES